MSSNSKILQISSDISIHLLITNTYIGVLVSCYFINKQLRIPIINQLAELYYLKCHTNLNSHINH